jgi:hypothetical protein
MSNLFNKVIYDGQFSFQLPEFGHETGWHVAAKMEKYTLGIQGFSNRGRMEDRSRNTAGLDI